MTADVFSTGASLSHSYILSPIGERKAMETSNSSLLSFSELEPTISNPEPRYIPTIIMRRLPRNTNDESLRSMLLFAKDLINTEIIKGPFSEDEGFVSAIARFKSVAGAQEARDMLNGKANAANDAKMIVELMPCNPVAGAIGARRNTVDGTATRQTSSTSSGVSSNGRQSSRFNGTFQSMDKMSPPNGASTLGKGEFPVPDGGVFGPKSPMGTAFKERSSKQLINEDAGDDETSELIKDPVAYARNGQNAPVNMARRTTNPQIPVTRFGSLSLNTTSPSTGLTSPPMSAFTSPRSLAPVQSPGPAITAMSPHSITSSMSMGPNTNYQMTPQHYQRHNYPPVNPADQNPPCNTLYVGNLPIDTSEDELKAMFSKQRGYKRLCFRTKQNGPMCFVEFEDVSFATKALNDLYGHPLHNSVKGGIRLSFSKNPLGVRTGQQNTMPATPMTPQSAMPGMGSGLGMSPAFSTATGPPPGLTPPGLTSPVNMNGSSSFGMFSNGPFGVPPMRAQPLAGGMGTGGAASGFGGGMNAAYSDYMMGR
ncbi:uncharacterized protein K452DRAFT_311058 [Aplosporella prunicola CBS 121167]|uniref:RRM domain-containing protein n=1 Tax=Aplosporella prunicola CBS 121167 TaxID=1176127 RepID=A0A6A6B884_9PEZI|nr:uncharacterized protein K452DRAFT_311058 [Aplosporella prunicola CBS 121167]KAF2139117.1 hypothetical protein K452DRAFT_311058 [Aplosporella prunicola CBS 121167]